MLSEQLHELMNKEVDRKEFLVHLGVGLVALTGAAGVLKALVGDNHKPSSSRFSRFARKGSGYGASKYGV